MHIISSLLETGDDVLNNKLKKKKHIIYKWTIEDHSEAAKLGHVHIYVNPNITVTKHDMKCTCSTKNHQIQF